MTARVLVGALLLLTGGAMGWWIAVRARRPPATPPSGDAGRTRFFGNIVHELRTPLTLVLGQIDAALTETDPAKRSHQLRVAQRSARRIERLAEQALALTRLDAGALRPTVRDLEVTSFLESLVMSFEELAERKGVLLEFVARPRQVMGRLDADHLTTIVSNLVSNAFKYTPAGGRVGVAAELRPPDRLVITVADTGPGVPADRREEVFRRFSRGPDDDTRHPGGAGIGLALARELARTAGGDLTLDTVAPQGAHFRVTLPLGVTAPEAPGVPLDATRRPEVTDEILHRTTAEGVQQPSDPPLPAILVVDDNADLREWIASTLAGVGLATGVSGAEAALEAAQALVPDLVVSDVRMAGMDGVELCRRLRADERTSHVPIVLLSVRSEVEARLGGLEAGADEYLPKPIDARELVVRVKGLLQRHEALRERFRERVIVKPADVSARSVDQAFFERVVATVEDEIGNPDFSVPELAGAVAMSTSQLTRKLRALVGQSPAQLVRGMRMERAAALIAADAGTLAQIGYRVGFSDQAHFSRTFKRHFGKTPGQYKDEAARLPGRPLPR